MRWLLLVAVGCSAAAPKVVTSPTGWRDLQRLAGTWSGTADSGATVALVIRPIANASALAETFGAPGHETMTLYHADRGGLVATHYCAQGNQPRLRATTIEPDHVVFTQADVTDLDPDEAVLVELDLRFAAGAFDRIETYRAPSGALERTTWRFTPAAR